MDKNSTKKVKVNIEWHVIEDCEGVLFLASALDGRRIHAYADEVIYIDEKGEEVK